VKHGGFKKGNWGEHLDAVDEAGHVAARLKTLIASAFKTSVDVEYVNFTVSAVPDALILHGPFRQYAAVDSLVSALVQIEPDSEV
jgi:hypothetical protein